MPQHMRLQWNSVITYPQGKWKKVRSKQSTFYPKQRKGKDVRLAMSVIDGESVITKINVRTKPCTYKPSFTIFRIQGAISQLINCQYHKKSSKYKWERRLSGDIDNRQHTFHPWCSARTTPTNDAKHLRVSGQRLVKPHHRQPVTNWLDQHFSQAKQPLLFLQS